MVWFELSGLKLDECFSASFLEFLRCIILASFPLWAREKSRIHKQLVSLQTTTKTTTTTNQPTNNENTDLVGCYDAFRRRRWREEREHTYTVSNAMQCNGSECLLWVHRAKRYPTLTESGPGIFVREPFEATVVAATAMMATQAAAAASRQFAIETPGHRNMQQITTLA